jgi:hypothetical protein
MVTYGSDGFKIVQYDYVLGIREFEKNITGTLRQPSGLVQVNNELYIIDSNNSTKNIWKIQTQPPYTLILDKAIPMKSSYVSQVPSCMTKYFEPNIVLPTPTPVPGVYTSFLGFDTL